MARGAQVRRFALYNLHRNEMGRTCQEASFQWLQVPSPMPCPVCRGGIPLRHSGRASEPESSPGTCIQVFFMNCFESPAMRRLYMVSGCPGGAYMRLHFKGSRQRVKYSFILLQTRPQLGSPAGFRLRCAAELTGHGCRPDLGGFLVERRKRHRREPNVFAFTS